VIRRAQTPSARPLALRTCREQRACNSRAPARTQPDSVVLFCLPERCSGVLVLGDVHVHANLFRPTLRRALAAAMMLSFQAVGTLIVAMLTAHTVQNG